MADDELQQRRWTNLLARVPERCLLSLMGQELRGPDEPAGTVVPDFGEELLKGAVYRFLVCQESDSGELALYNCVDLDELVACLEAEYGEDDWTITAVVDLDSGAEVEWSARTVVTCKVSP